MKTAGVSELELILAAFFKGAHDSLLVQDIVVLSDSTLGFPSMEPLPTRLSELRKHDPVDECGFAACQGQSILQSDAPCNSESVAVEDRDPEIGIYLHLY